MTKRFFASSRALAVVAIALPLASAAVAGQGTPSTSQGRTHVATSPRTPDGQPDLQGVWTFATVTPLQRPDALAGKTFLTEQEAADFEKRLVEQQDVDRRDPSSLGTAADVGRAYNQFWYDRGTKVIGTRRTSLIVDPPDGKIPALTPEGQQRVTRNARRGTDDPENRSLWERCITHSSVPRLSTGYNNNLQIFQSPGYVIIVYEMIHETRIIPLDGRPHLDQKFRLWLGDSRGRWEGNRLVVDTTNFSDKTSFQGSSANMHLVERFTRVDANTLNYEFTVEDPTTWTRPWTAALPMPKIDEQMYEYACHEGNYGLAGQLRGARVEERDAAEAAARERR
jgi:hypothetical protein